MANFPQFDDIYRDLSVLLDDPQFVDLMQLSDDGRTYFNQIVDRISTLTPAGMFPNQKTRAEMLAHFAKELVKREFDFNSHPQGQDGFTPLGLLFKDLDFAQENGKVVKHVFRALLNNHNIDWYQVSTLQNGHAAQGPMLLKVLTHTTRDNIVKRINECTQHGIVIDFNRLQATMPQVHQVGFMAPQVLHAHISQTIQSQNGMGANLAKFKNVLLALTENHATNLEYFIGCTLLQNMYSGIKYQIQVMGELGVKIDLHHPGISLRQLLSKQYNNTSDISDDIENIKLLQSIHEGGAIDPSHFFSDRDNFHLPLPMDGAPIINAWQNTGPQLMHHIFRKVQGVMPHLNKFELFQAAIEGLSSLANIAIDMNATDPAGQTGWHTLISSITNQGRHFMPDESISFAKKTFKELIKINSINKTQLVAIFMQYMPIDAMIKILEKTTPDGLSLIEPFSVNHTFVNFRVGDGIQQIQWFNNIMFRPENKTSILDMLFSYWQYNKLTPDNLSILEKLQKIDSNINLGQHLYKPTMGAVAGNQNPVGLLNCINIVNTAEGIVKIVNCISDLGIEIQMHESYAPMFAAVAEYPVGFKAIKQLQMFKVANPKVIAKFMCNVAQESFSHILQSLVSDEVVIDFSDDMPMLLETIGCKQKMVMGPGGLQMVAPAPANQISLTPFALSSIFELLTSEQIAINSDAALIDGKIVNNRPSRDALEVIKILQEYNASLKCDLMNIAYSAWDIINGPADANSRELKVELLRLIQSFNVEDFNWVKYFVHTHHNNIHDDWDIFFANVQSIEPLEIAKTLLVEFYNIENALGLIRTKINPNLSEIIYEGGDTIWHSIVKNPNFIHYCNTIMNHNPQFSIANEDGVTAFAILVDAQPTHSMYHLLEQILPTLVAQGVDFNSKTPAGTFLLTKIASDVNSIRQVIEINEMCSRAGIELNINLVDKSGNRVIDYAAAFFKADSIDVPFIRVLRELGSVESKTPIARSIDYKVDVSDGRLEGYANNRLNAKKLIDHLYRQYELSDDEIDRAIQEFKTRDDINIPFGRKNAPRIEWAQNDPVVNTIPMVIDSISGAYAGPVYSIGTDAQLLLDEAAWSAQPGSTPARINGKKLIGTMIHAVMIQPNLEVVNPNTGPIKLYDLFLHTLCTMHACIPGKLVNLAAIIQEIVCAENPDINYMDEGFNVQYHALSNGVFELAAQKFQDNLPIAIARWALDMTTNRDCPELWAYSSQKMHGIINQAIAGIGGIDHQSYHFTRILMDRICNNEIGQGLAYQVNPQVEVELEKEINPAWVQAAREGVTVIARNFCDELVRQTHNDVGLVELIESAANDVKVAFGNFACVSSGVFIDCVSRVAADKQAQVLVLLIDNITFDDRTMSMLSERLLAQIDSNPEGFADAIESNPTVLKMLEFMDIKYSLNKLYLFAREYNIDAIFDWFAKNIRDDLLDEVVPIVFTEDLIASVLLKEGMFDKVLASVRDEMLEEERQVVGLANEDDDA